MRSVMHSITSRRRHVQRLSGNTAIHRRFHHNLMMMLIHELSFIHLLTWATAVILVYLFHNSLFVCLLLCWWHTHVCWLFTFTILETILEICMSVTQISCGTTELSVWLNVSSRVSCLFTAHSLCSICTLGFIVADLARIICATNLAQAQVIIWHLVSTESICGVPTTPTFYT